jgi:hypothetical protein
MLRQVTLVLLFIGLLVGLLLSYITHDPIQDKLVVSLLVIIAGNILKRLPLTK